MKRNIFIKIRNWFKSLFSKQKPIKKKVKLTPNNDPWWAEFKKAQTKTYKCVDCGKVLISNKHLDLDFYHIEKVGMYCVKDYEKRLNANDPIITAYHNRYHRGGKK